MAFHPFEVNVPHLAYALLGGFVVIFGMFSLLIKERLYIGEAVIATLIGIAIGPHAAGLFNPIHWGGAENVEVTNEITLEVTRVVIAIGVFAVGVELPKKYCLRHWKSLAYLLGPCMVWGWLVSALLMWGILGRHLDFLSCLAVAACVTPTDPILAQAVVGGKFADKHVPAHIRHILSAESGSNDGAAFPFLYIALYLILDADDAHAVGEWFYVTWLYEVVLGIVIGTLIGFVARKTMIFCEAKGLIDRQSFVAQYVSLAVLTIGATTLLGSDDLLAAFACGTAFAWDGFFNKATEDSMFSNVIDLLFNCAAFIYIGAIIPFDEWQDDVLHLSVWRLVLLSMSILALRRLPIIMAIYKFIPDIKTSREAAFVGWFGPMGVGAIFISTLARNALPTIEHDPVTQVELLSRTIQPIVAFLVLTSVLAHGLSIPFFSLTRRVHSITHTWSRQSIDRRDEPAWTSHTRRITPGDIIRVNRDDEGGDIADEIADDGAEDRGMPVQKDFGRTSSDPSQDSEDTTAVSGGSGSGGAYAKRGGEREVVAAMENGTYTPDERTEAQRDIDDDDGRTTPILAEYREGHHLVRERKGKDVEEVEVEVVQNYFHDKEDNQKSTFKHPKPLRHHEVDKLHGKLDDGAEDAAAEVRDGGTDAVDKLGLGLMGPEAREEDEREEAEKVRDDKKRQRNMAQNDKSEGEREREEQEDLAESSTKYSGTQPKPKSRRMSIRQKLFGQKHRDRSPDSQAEAGEGGSGGSNPATATYHEMRERARTSPSLQGQAKREPEQPRESSLRLQRTASVATDRNRDREPDSETSSTIAPTTVRPNTQDRTIRFAPDAPESSATAPGLQYYRRPANHNPELQMHRTASVQSNHSGRSARMDGQIVSSRMPAR